MTWEWKRPRGAQTEVDGQRDDMGGKRSRGRPGLRWMDRVRSDGREETSRKAQTEVDGQSVERHGREEISRKAQTEVDGQSVERRGREETSRKGLRWRDRV